MGLEGKWMVLCLDLSVHRTRLLKQDVSRHNGMHGTMTHGHDKQSHACIHNVQVEATKALAMCTSP